MGWVQGNAGQGPAFTQWAVSLWYWTHSRKDVTYYQVVGRECQVRGSTGQIRRRSHRWVPMLRESFGEEVRCDSWKWVCEARVWAPEGRKWDSVSPGHLVSVGSLVRTWRSVNICQIEAKYVCLDLSLQDALVSAGALGGCERQLRPWTVNPRLPGSRRLAVRLSLLP